MFAKLDELKEKLTGLENRLSDPEVIANQQEYKKAAQEHAQVSKLYNLYSQYQKVNQELDDNRGLLQDEEDAELLELVRNDIAELTEKAERLRSVSAGDVARVAGELFGRERAEYVVRGA